MHNGLWFDLPVLNKLLGYKLDPKKVIDTLVVSRLVNSWDHNRHGLAEWGERLGFPKQDHKDFSEYSEKMVEYCVNDVLLTEKVFLFLKKYITDPKNKLALRIEHNASIICKEMNENGFGFDHKRAEELFKEISILKDALYEELQRAFPPKSYLVREINPVPTQTGKIHSKDFRFLEKGSPEENGYTVNGTFSLIDFEPFNPAATKQIVARLNEYGWKPFEKTKGHILAEKNRDKKLPYFKEFGWMVSEENLKTLPETAPKSAQSLVRYITLTRRLTTLTEWLNAYNPDTKSIHGQINSIGTWTHRCSHKAPNTGNIIRVQKRKKEVLWGEEGGWGADYRNLWQTRPGYKLVGCDAEGIQLRILAHYMEDKAFTDALISGNSEDGTDVHTLNMSKLNTRRFICRDRDDSKTFIYSWVLGAAAPKTASVLKCSVPEAVMAREDFLKGYPGLKRVKEELIPIDVHNGYFVGFDGRLVKCDSAHLMLAGYLQNGEAVIMKYANELWKQRLKKEGIPFHQVNFVHDEWQTEVLDENDYPNIVGKIQADSIVQAGIELGVKCPQAGKYVTGRTWFETH